MCDNQKSLNHLLGAAALDLQVFKEVASRPASNSLLLTILKILDKISESQKYRLLISAWELPELLRSHVTSKDRVIQAKCQTIFSKQRLLLFYSPRERSRSI